MAYTRVDMPTLFWIDSPTIYNNHCSKIENWYLNKLFTVSYFTSKLQVINGEGHGSGFNFVFHYYEIPPKLSFKFYGYFGKYVLTKDLTIYT